MAIVDCECGQTPSNTGSSPCNVVERPTSRRVLMLLYDSAGVRNSIDLAQVGAASYFENLINEEDASKRLFPLPKIKNTEPTKADADAKTYNDGTTIYLGEGVKSVTELFSSQNRTFLGKLKSWRGCNLFGEFSIDASGTLRGVKGDGVLYPRPINEQAFNPVWSDPKPGSDPNEIVLTFAYPKEDREEEIGYITASEMGDFNWLQTNGLLDVNQTITTPTITAITIKLELDYGSELGKIALEGRDVADWGDPSNAGRFYNNTTMAWVDILTAPENPEVPGEYTLTYVAQTTLDVARFPMTMTNYDASGFAFKTAILA